MQRADFFHRDQPARDHPIEHGQEALDLLLAVDDLIDHRQVHRKPQDFRSVHPAGFAETDRAPERGCTRQMHLSRLQNDRFVKWPMLVSVALADEDSQQGGFVRDFH